MWYPNWEYLRPVFGTLYLNDSIHSKNKKNRSKYSKKKHQYIINDGNGHEWAIDDLDAEINSGRLKIVRNEYDINFIPPDVAVLLMYDTSRTDYIVDSKDHPRANKKYQFIHSPNFQPTVRESYYGGKQCFVIQDTRKNPGSSTVVLSVGNLYYWKNKHWIFIVSIEQTTNSQPIYTIEYQCVLKLSKF